jgi:photosystem II stability/assembly factor-like uncharacterized protein
MTAAHAPRPRLAGAVVAAALLLAPPAARGDGAFPDSQSILTPADRPDQIILGTNFGLILSEDGGQSWTWSCEQPTNSYGRLYQLGPAPASRLFALALTELVYSADLSCSWGSAGGMLAGASALDVFPDPSSAARVVAVAQLSAGGGAGGVVLESSDGGATFGELIFQAAAGDVVSGVEIARSDPQTIYVTLSNDSMLPPQLARTADGGATWQTFPLGSSLGSGEVRLLAVDPDDAETVFLRWNAPGGDSLLLATDGGATVSQPLTISGGTMSAFARLDSGAVLIGANVGGAPVIFRSTDGGLTFQKLTGGPHLRALSARGAVLYGVGDDGNDGYAIATSLDQGTSWQALMSYADVQAVTACVSAQCQGGCQVESGLGLWDARVCQGGGPQPAADGGDGRADGGVDDAGVAMTDGGPADGRGEKVTPADGCGCGVGAPSRPGAAAGWASLAGWLPWLLLPLRPARARGRRRGARTGRRSIHAAR